MKKRKSLIASLSIDFLLFLNLDTRPKKLFSQPDWDDDAAAAATSRQEGGLWESGWDGDAVDDEFGRALKAALDRGGTAAQAPPPAPAPFAAPPAPQQQQQQQPPQQQQQQ